MCGLPVTYTNGCGVVFHIDALLMTTSLSDVHPKFGQDMFPRKESESDEKYEWRIKPPRTPPQNIHAVWPPLSTFHNLNFQNDIHEDPPWVIHL